MIVTNLMTKLGATSWTAAMLTGLLVLGATGTEAQAGPPTAACDPLDPALCLLPFPNDVFTADDAGTDTGLRSPSTRPSGTATTASHPARRC
jgi:hypothetical protein